MKQLKVGQRVVHDGSVGYVESIDDGWCDVRWLTPNNEPSCCVSFGPMKIYIPVPDSVVPMRRNAAWWKESREFCASIHDAIISSDM